MATLTKRVQVLLDPLQYQRLDEIARQRNRSVGALIRDAIDRVYLQSAAPERLEAVQALAAMQLPVADWEQMERESVEEVTPNG
jgi:predicted DNA-binding ribbon-helix-helix protein